MIRLLRTSFLVASACALIWSLAPNPSVAARGPAPQATPTAAPAPLPTATPEPPDKAIPRLEAAIKANPNDRQSIADLAGYFLQLSRPDLALQLTQRALRLGAKTAQVYYIDGAANAQLGRIPQATADFEQASNLEPTNSGVLFQLTQLYLREKRYADADRVAKRALKFNPNDPPSHMNYGLVLAEQSQFDAARVELETAAKLAPTDPSAIILIARTYAFQKQFPTAVQMLDRALSVDPNSVEALLTKARIQGQQHDVPSSVATYTLLVSKLSDNNAKVQYLSEEAAMLEVEKKTGDAEALLKKTIADYPAVLHAHIAYGDFLAERKRLGEAEKEWSAGLGAAKDNTEALGRLSQLYLGSKRYTQAAEYLRKLTNAQPGNAQSWNLLGRTYVVLHDYGRSRDAFRHVFELTRTPDALAGIGAADFELRNYKEAAQIFDLLDKQTRPYMNQNPQFIFIMARSYEQTKQKAKAKAAYRRFLSYVKVGTPAYKKVQQYINNLR